MPNVTGTCIQHKGEWYFVPSKEDIQNIREGSKVLNPFGKWATVTKGQEPGNIHGKMADLHRRLEGTQQ